MAKIFCAYCGQIYTVTRRNSSGGEHNVFCNHACALAFFNFQRLYSDHNINSGDVKTDLVIWLKEQKR